MYFSINSNWRVYLSWCWSSPLSLNSFVILVWLYLCNIFFPIRLNYELNWMPFRSLLLDVFALIFPDLYNIEIICKLIGNSRRLVYIVIRYLRKAWPNKHYNSKSFSLIFLNYFCYFSFPIRLDNQLNCKSFWSLLLRVFFVITFSESYNFEILD